MDPIFAEVLEFSDRARVERTLQLIDGSTKTLALGEPAAGWRLAIKRLWLDEDNALVLEAAPVAWAGLELPSAGLELLAAAGSETLAFDGMAPLFEAAAADSGRRRFSVPERLRVQNKRAGLRLVFVKGMSARFEINADGSAPLVARVIDLSIGGCQIELPMAAALTLPTDDTALDTAIVFPNGERFEAAAVTRHVRALGTGGLARAGLAFEGFDNEARQRLWLWLHEIEMEIAARRGERSASRQAPGLFRSGGGRSPVSAGTGARPPRYRTAMRKPLLGVARDLSRAALAIRADQPLPAEALTRAAACLCNLLAADRQAFLFALALLTEQPPLIQHSLAVAGRLADLVMADTSLTVDPGEIALGALLHDLELVRLPENVATTLAAARGRAAVQRGDHVARMRDRIAPQPALAISTVDALLQGLGVPAEAIDGPCAAVIRAARVVKAVDVRVRGYHGQPPMTAFDACRQLYRERDDFDAYWVRRYVQRQGPYPIGTMVRYRNGFRAQVVALDDRGRPACVRVLRNLRAAGHQRLNVVLDGVDLHQLGTLEHAVAHEPQELYAPPVAGEH